MENPIKSLLENNETVSELYVNKRANYIRLDIHQIYYGDTIGAGIPLSPNQIIQLIKELKAGLNWLTNQ